MRLFLLLRRSLLLDRPARFLGFSRGLLLGGHEYRPFGAPWDATPPYAKSVLTVPMSGGSDSFDELSH